MPYDSIEEIPEDVRRAIPSVAGQEIWRTAYNEADANYDPAKHEGSREEYASKIAWTALKNAGYSKQEEGWIKASQEEDVLTKEEYLKLVNELKTHQYSVQTTLFDLTALKDMSREEKREKLKDRAKQYGVSIRPDANLSPPAGYPTDIELYADRVNLMYPINSPERCRAAKVYLIRNKNMYPDTADVNKVYERIIRKGLSLDIQFGYDETNPQDKALPEELKKKLAGRMAAELDSDDWLTFSLQDLTQLAEFTPEDLWLAKEDRARKYRISMKANSHLKPPSGGSYDIRFYGDPVNLLFPISSREQIQQAILHLESRASDYSPKEIEFILSRIIRRGLALGMQFSENSFLKESIPSDLKEQIFGYSFSYATDLNTDDHVAFSKEGRIRFQVLPKIGTMINHPVTHKPITFTRQMYESIVNNFKRDKKVPIQLGDKPHSISTQDTQGWAINMEIKNDELWADGQITEDSVMDKIKRKTIRFVSASIEDLNNNPLIREITLTNFPFLRNLKPIVVNFEILEKQLGGEHQMTNANTTTQGNEEGTGTTPPQEEGTVQFDISKVPPEVATIFNTLIAQQERDRGRITQLEQSKKQAEQKNLQLEQVVDTWKKQAELEKRIRTEKEVDTFLNTMMDRGVIIAETAPYARAILLSQEGEENTVQFELENASGGFDAVKMLITEAFKAFLEKSKGVVSFEERGILDIMSFESEPGSTEVKAKVKEVVTEFNKRRNPKVRAGKGNGASGGEK